MIQTLPLQTPHNLRVKLQKMDFSWLCPLRDEVDYASVTIEYEPSGCVIVTESLYEYLSSFRTKQALQEELTQSICDRLVEACHPRSLSVTVAETPGWGIVITCTSEFLEGKS
jgi:7-cyano-7-deazaguanine reductase